MGVVVGLYVAARARDLPRTAESVRVLAGGIEGDRYLAGAGTFSSWPGDGRHVTLVEQEALDALAVERGIALEPAAARRNVVTRGIALNELVGRSFRVGTALLRGTRLCDPCAHLEQLTEPGVLAGLVHRGGLRADVVEPGAVRVGDAVEPVA